MRSFGEEEGARNDRKRPVVLIGPYEHHSNEVMWRETIAEACCIIRRRHCSWACMPIFIYLTMNTCSAK